MDVQPSCSHRQSDFRVKGYLAAQGRGIGALTCTLSYSGCKQGNLMQAPAGKASVGCCGFIIAGTIALGGRSVHDHGMLFVGVILLRSYA
jgi:hypothetical protein